MHIYISLYHLMMIIPIVFTVVSMFISAYAQDGVNALRWFIAMTFGAGASLTSVIWYWIVLVK